LRLLPWLKKLPLFSRLLRLKLPRLPQPQPLKLNRLRSLLRLLNLHRLLLRWPNQLRLLLSPHRRNNLLLPRSPLRLNSLFLRQLL
jgi:hypothetical protein